MATDYISREAAIAMAFDYRIDVIENDYDKGYQTAVKDIAKGLNALPAADVRPVVRGHWANAHPSSPMMDGGGPPYCSVCGKEVALRSVVKTRWKFDRGLCSQPEVVRSSEEFLSNFCPNCGADMRPKKPDFTNHTGNALDYPN